ncbi:transcription factor TFIIIC complex subunit Sfc4 [Schizosaccharomyces pombe]|uniref:Transcription factor tau subunit sfc4 n=1 Tax=Schizosaccharomyces pombe (strain 972 / ATCC 24843) TaxID=284812 RepID=SFC4_SCHPO|nr:transcription factor TFIIIC subunit Sfc4 [Schizosaccharomyces pombe]O74458.1 RecName: Full=Transcription factor tau subunit sfc4; AltName: Full=TFIIIC subunit sfc4; AltName: Full=Transcription factor C subunit 4 [Schizosaccharomyces pombe 972h-]CAA20753.1 transcription factor TFIIIC complex subunit Sfc4 [Schizosaccharomyces pombe]|eukprot:NP_587924.1 transcription factor TFIIIC subunit Sfc4 [Schizosaccharomyces pombe]
MIQNGGNSYVDSNMNETQNDTTDNFDAEMQDLNGYISEIVDEARNVSEVDAKFLGDTSALQAEGLWSDEESDYEGSDDESNFSKTASRTEDDIANEEWEENLKAVAGFRKVRKGHKGRGRVSRADMLPSVEVQQMLSLANHLFAQEGNFDEAQKLAEEIVRIDNNVIAAWKMLGECHRQRGNGRVNIEKCLIAWMAAAHLKPKDHELWFTCAKLSESLEFWDQADYCYNRAVSAKPPNKSELKKYIWNRSVLNKEHGSLKKAAEGFKFLLQSSPYNASILKNLAEIYIKIHAPREILKQFEIAWKYFYQYPAPPIGNDIFDLPTLNLYAELLLLDHQWSNLIRLINRGVRWFRGRKSESFWDEFDDDREWDVDERRREFPNASEEHTNKEAYLLPHLFRTKLGIARLKTGELPEAELHFSVIKNLPPDYAWGMLYDIAKAYMDIERLDLALEYFVLICNHEPAQNIGLWYNMGVCYLELKEYEHAQQCMEAILIVDNSNTNALIKLAEINELQDNRDAALEIVTNIFEQRRNINELEREQSQNEDHEKNVGSQLFVGNQKVPQDKWEKRARISRSKEEARQFTIWKTEETQRRFHKLDILRQSLKKEENVSESLNEWLAIASELIDEFVSIKAFFPSEKKARARAGLLTRRTRYASLNDQLTSMINRLNDSLTRTKYGDLDLDTILRTGYFRNVSIDAWYQLFVEFSLRLTKVGSVQQAYDVLTTAMGAILFDQDTIKRQNLRWCMLACSMYARDPQGALTPLRWVFTTFQFRQDTYRLFSAVLSQGYECSRAFVDSANQKFLLRLIKLMDQLMSNSLVSGAATLVKNDDGLATVPTSYDPVLVLLYGHIMARNRSWIPAINYYSRAFAINPDCPITNLSLGLAYLHRAMQRLSDNRHYQILQGFTFLYRYYDLRVNEGLGEKQEALYNLGKAYHFIGLEHYAVKYYEAVLGLSPMSQGDKMTSSESTVSTTYDFGFEAAYNLRLIYICSGNIKLAFQISSKYLIF